MGMIVGEKTLWRQCTSRYSFLLILCLFIEHSDKIFKSLKMIIWKFKEMWAKDSTKTLACECWMSPYAWNYLYELLVFQIKFLNQI